jgi:hypothetical protein
VLASNQVDKKRDSIDELSTILPRLCNKPKSKARRYWWTARPVILKGSSLSARDVTLQSRCSHSAPQLEVDKLKTIRRRLLCAPIYCKRGKALLALVEKKTVQLRKLRESPILEAPLTKPFLPCGKRILLVFCIHYLSKSSVLQRLSVCVLKVSNQWWKLTGQEVFCNWPTL